MAGQVQRLSENATEAALSELRALAGERLTISRAIRETHGQDESWHETVAPDAVAFANSTEEVPGQAFEDRLVAWKQG